MVVVPMQCGRHDATTTNYHIMTTYIYHFATYDRTSPVPFRTTSPDVLNIYIAGMGAAGIRVAVEPGTPAEHLAGDAATDPGARGWG